MLSLIIVFLLAFIVTCIVTPFLIKATKKAGITGRDIHKPGKPVVAELGGLAIAAGIIFAVLFAIGVNSFLTLQAIFDMNASIILLLAALTVVLMIELIGFVDDILGVRHKVKFLLPLFAALPLIAVKATTTVPLTLPLIGAIEMITPLIYVIILIPIGVTAATNLTNVFAGFNGMESGMGAVAALSLFAIGFVTGSMEVMILSTAFFGALLAFLFFNWYPAKIFPDDVGTLLIGAMIATIVIIGRIEFAGLILLLPHIIDFIFFKIPNKLPSEGWGGELKEGKLAWTKKPVHFAQWIMQKTGGISEKALVGTFIIMEIVLGIIAIAIYL